jgi:hypothetical protein
MRFLIAILIAAFILEAPAAAAKPSKIEFTSREAVLLWIYRYRAKPDPGRVPAAARALAQIGALREPDSSGVFIGFIAGVIGSNPARAEELIAGMFPLPPEDQWAIVRAIAYSCLPEWKALLAKFAERMPTRQVMIDRYLEGKLPTLNQVATEKSPGLLEKLRLRSSPKEVALEPTPELLDTVWGYYFATGGYSPIARIISMLSWSKDRNSIDKLTLGSMAKYTLASNASRDSELLSMLKRSAEHQSEKVAPILKEVIEAAETVDTARVRKEALAAISELQRKGPGYKRDGTFWGQVGQGALALGCIAAAATGHVELGLPCVLGGAASSAALHFWSAQ